jgi:hypothetical protein
MIETRECAFNKDRYRSDSGESKKRSKFKRWDMEQRKKAGKLIGDADDKVRAAEMKIDPTGTLSEMNPVHIARMKKGKEKRKAVGQLALNILFPFAPIMRAIKKRRKMNKNKQHSDDGVVRIYDNDSGMIAEENNYY